MKAQRQTWLQMGLLVAAVTILSACAAPNLNGPIAAESKIPVQAPTPRVDGIDVSKLDYEISSARFQAEDGSLVSNAKPTADDADRIKGTIAWTRLAQEGNRFSYIRITYGDSAVAEPTAKRNWDEAKAAGLYVGPYHYFIPSAFKEKIVRQAQHFLASFEKVEAGASDNFLPLALDIEDKQTEYIKKYQLSPAAYRLAICTWLDVVKKSPRFRDREIILYTDPDFYDRWGIKNDSYCALGKYRVWLADPFTSDAASYWKYIDIVCDPKAPEIYGKCIIVQHSGTYPTSAVPSGQLDVNWFIGDESELKALMLPTPAEPNS